MLLLKGMCNQNIVLLLFISFERTLKTVTKTPFPIFHTSLNSGNIATGKRAVRHLGLISDLIKDDFGDVTCGISLIKLLVCGQPTIIKCFKCFQFI